MPDCDSAFSASSSRLRRVHQAFQRRELRRDAELHRVRVLLRMLERIGRVDLGFELDRLDRRTLEAERLRALAAAVAARALHLVAARERVGVVLQRDGALDGAAGGVEHDEAAFDELGATGE